MDRRLATARMTSNIDGPAFATSLLTRRSCLFSGRGSKLAFCAGHWKYPAESVALAGPAEEDGEMPETHSTHQKALQINVDAKRYGTFAEIGGGQEVARWFFAVGGAAGTSRPSTITVN